MDNLHFKRGSGGVPYLPQCLRQISFLESMSLHYVLSQLVLIKENKTKVFIAQRVLGPSKQLKQITQIEHNIVKIPTIKKTCKQFLARVKNLRGVLTIRFCLHTGN